MRCFVAIELPPGAVLALGAAGCAIRELDATWANEKWATPDVLHVTLKFLGNVDKPMVDRLGQEIAAAFSQVPVFPLELTGLRAVPEAGRASMIWASVVDSSGGCRNLARAANQVAVRNGIEPESRPFVPHVTLVRARMPRRVESDVLTQATESSGLGAVIPVSVLSATLFSSTLTPRGPVHERLLEFALQGEMGSDRSGRPGAERSR